MLSAMRTSDFIKSLTKNDKEIMEKFLMLYRESSHRGYISSISLLYQRVGKKKFAEYTIQDYHNCSDILLLTDVSQNILRTTFIKYLYAFDLLDDPDGFQHEWIKKDIYSHFIKQANMTYEKKEDVQILLKPSMMKVLDDIIDCDEDSSIEDLLDSFFAYMIVYTDCPIDSLRKKFEIHEYRSGNIEGFHVDKKYDKVFKYLKDETKAIRLESALKKSTQNILTKLGIENMTEVQIRNAAKQHMVLCCNCGKYSSSKSENWKVANGRLVCSQCADELKKKAIITPVLSIDWKPYEKFEKKKKELFGKIDFLEKHRLQIEIGRLCELYVFEYEKVKLYNTVYFDAIDITKADDPRNGYDILSYNIDGEPLYIEVKGTNQKKHTSFYISSHEMEILRRCKKEGKMYKIYSVADIMNTDRKKVVLNVIDDIDKEFNLSVETWRVNRKY